MPESIHFTDAEKASYRNVYAPTASDAHWNLFIQECERRALVPGVDVVFQLRDTKEYNEQLRASVDGKRVVFITTISALRLIAERSGKYAGHGPFTFYYQDGVDTFKSSVVPFGRIPHAVSVEGYRKDWQVPMLATARYLAYVQNKDGGPSYMWTSRAEEMTAKCAEALMLRTVAPEECSGILISEELDNGVDAPAIDKLKQDVAPATIPQATVAPTVNQSAGFGESTQSCIDANPTFKSTPVNPDVHTEPIAVAAEAPADPKWVKADYPPVPPPPQAPPAPSTVKPAAVDGDAPATPKEFSDFISGRATKIIRDKLPKAGMKEGEASNCTKNYLLKQSGKAGLKQIGAATFERLLKALEDATPEQAAEIVRTQSK